MMEYISIADWRFHVDIDATRDYTIQCSTDHCLCPYCRNFYDTVDGAHPRLRSVLEGFGIYLDGPCEVMPVEHDLILAAYRVTGSITHAGKLRLYVDEVPLIPEDSENGTFLLWVGPMDLPWIQDVAPEDVISPANEPEFLERMAQKMLSLMDFDPIES